MEQLEFTKIIVGVSGGSGSGKTTLCQTISNEMIIDSHFNVLILSLDCFQKGILDFSGDVADFNFDDPDFIDWDLAYSTVKTLIAGGSVSVPTYDFAIHQRHPPELWMTLQPQDIIFVEGIFALWDDKLRSLMNYQIFIDCDSDIRLCRRLIRDVRDRGRDTLGVLVQYNRFVGPCHELYVMPQSKKADLVVPGFKNNNVAVTLIVQQLKHQCRELNALKFQMRHQLLFFGDRLDNLQVVVGFQKDISDNDFQDSMQRRVFFLNDKQLQKEVMVFVGYLNQNEQFSLKQYEGTLKSSLKYTFKILFNALHLLNIKGSSILPLSLKDLIKSPQIRNQYIIVVVPYLIDQQGIDLIQSLTDMAQKNNSQIMVLNIFGHIDNIMVIPKNKSSLLFIVNLFLFSKTEKFNQCLSNISNNEFPKIVEQMFLVDKLYEKLKKFILKIN